MDLWHDFTHTPGGHLETAAHAREFSNPQPNPQLLSPGGACAAFWQPANMQAALSGRKARPKCIDEANAGYLITSCMLLRGARHVRFRPSYDFAMSSYILRNQLRIIGG